VFISFLIGFLFFATARSVGATSAVFSDTQSFVVSFQAGFWGCTYSQGYWKNHPDDWPVEEVVLGEVKYIKTEAIEILKTPPKGDATYILAHQLIAAMLNFANGANSNVIEGTITAADGWLMANELGSDPREAEREKGIELSESLESFNTGEIWPGACDDDISEDDEEDSEDPPGEDKEEKKETDPPEDEQEADDPDEDEGEIEDGDQAENSDDLTADSQVDVLQCTRDSVYWSSHTDSWPVEEIEIGGVAYSVAEAHALLQISDDGDITYSLAQELLVLKLNLYGVEPTSDTLGAIGDADAWLVTHPLGTNPGEPDREEGVRLTQMLQSHSQELEAEGECAEETAESSQELGNNPEDLMDQEEPTDEGQPESDDPNQSESPSDYKEESEEEEPAEAPSDSDAGPSSDDGS